MACQGHPPGQGQVRALVASHLGPGDPTILSNEGWRAALRDSGRQGGFGGPMLLGMDLMRIPLRRHSPTARNADDRGARRDRTELVMMQLNPPKTRALPAIVCP
jgi:hypothetical protein